MSYKIEKNIERPKSTQGRQFTYPWEDMEVDDSFFVPGHKPSLSSTAADWSKRNRDGKVRFTTLKRKESIPLEQAEELGLDYERVDAEQPGSPVMALVEGTRIWRTE